MIKSVKQSRCSVRQGQRREVSSTRNTRYVEGCATDNTLERVTFGQRGGLTGWNTCFLNEELRGTRHNDTNA